MLLPLHLIAALGALGSSFDAPPTAADTSPVATVAATAPLILVGRSDDRWQAVVHEQLSALDLRVVDIDQPYAPGLDVRLQGARDLVQIHGGLGVLWIEEGSTHFHLYLVRPFQNAVFRRSVAIDAAQPQQSLAQLGALTHKLAAALMRNERVGMQRIEVDGDPPAPVTRPTYRRARPVAAPDSTPSPPPTEAPHGQFHAGLAYVGTIYAPSWTWRNGLLTAAGWISPGGLHVEAGYTHYQTAEFQGEGRVLAVRRHPVHAALGYEHRWRWLRLGADAMVIVDRTRHTDYRAAGQRVLVRRGATTSLAIAPRVRIGVLASARVEVFAAFATEVWLRRAVYRLAAPFWVRATPSTGLAIRI